MERSHQCKRQWRGSGFLVGISIILLLGIVFRTVNLGNKAYWVDEVHTAVRVAGYTKEDITAERFDNQVHGVSDLNTYQFPSDDPSFQAVLGTLAQHPEHPPLYYLMARWWLQGWMRVGITPSITVMRSLSVLLGLLVLPGIAGLCWELWRSKWTVAIALSIFALSPLHILYSQEAREYSLWTAITVWSSWSLLRAIRYRTLRSWVLYGTTLVIGWYSHLLFATVAIAHSIYVGIIAQQVSPHDPPSITPSPTTQSTPKSSFSSAPASPISLGRSPLFLSFAATFCLSLLFFLPWILTLILHFGQIQAVVGATQRDPSISYLFNVWGRNLSRIWFNGDLASGNIVVVLGTLYAVGHLWRTTPRHIGALLVPLIGVNALVLIVPDLITGGISSTRIRYLIPAYVGLQLAVAHLFSSYLMSATGWSRRIWQGIILSILVSGAIAGGVNLSRSISWAKSDKAAYYPQMAERINESPNPLIITDASATYTLVLNAQLRQDIALQLVRRPKRLTIPSTVNGHQISDLFLFAPSDALQTAMITHAKAHGLEPPNDVVRQNDQFRLQRIGVTNVTEP